jgi:hypothetical protein
MLKCKVQFTRTLLLQFLFPHAKFSTPTNTALALQGLMLVTSVTKGGIQKLPEKFNIVKKPTDSWKALEEHFLIVVPVVFLIQPFSGENAFSGFF